MMMYSSLRNSYPFTISLRSTTTFSSGQIYCCFTRCLSGRCSMLKEIPLLRAPENKRTGIEMSPKVKCPDQTDAAIVPSRSWVFHSTCHSDQTTGLAQPLPWHVEESAASRPGHRRTRQAANRPRLGSLAYKPPLDAQILGHVESKFQARGNGVRRARAPAVVVS